MYIPRFPLHIVFILSNHCNLACSHCSSNADINGTRGYGTNEAKEIIDQLAGVGVVDVAYSGGDPLLRKDIPELIRYARDKGMSVGTSTNGYPLTDKSAIRLKDAGLSRLQISLDGDKRSHDEVRGPGSFSRAIKAIKTSKKHGLKTHVCFTAMNRNWHLLEYMLDLAIELGVDGFNLSQFVPTGRGQKDQGLTPFSAKQLLETWLAAKQAYPDLYLSAHSSGLAALQPREEDCRGGCQAGISIGCITAEGDVTPCVMLPLSIGNINQSKFRDIWNSSEYIQNLHERNVRGVCSNCSYKWQCGGCRAAAWAVSRSLMAEDPYCWLVESQKFDTQARC